MMMNRNQANSNDLSYFRHAVQHSLDRQSHGWRNPTSTGASPEAHTSPIGPNPSGSYGEMHGEASGTAYGNRNEPDASERDDTGSRSSDHLGKSFHSSTIHGSRWHAGSSSDLWGNIMGSTSKITGPGSPCASSTAGGSDTGFRQGSSKVPTQQHQQPQGWMTAASARVPPEIFSRVTVEQRVTTLALMNVGRLWKAHGVLPATGEFQEDRGDEGEGEKDMEKNCPPGTQCYFRTLRKSVEGLLADSEPRLPEWWRSDVIEPWTSLDSMLHDQGYHNFWDGNDNGGSASASGESEEMPSTIPTSARTGVARDSLHFLECRCALDLVTQLHQRLFSLLLPVDAYISFWNQRIERPLMEAIEQGPFHLIAPFWLHYESPQEKVSCLRDARIPLLNFLGKLRRSLASFATAQTTEATMQIAQQSLHLIKELLSKEIPESFRRRRKGSRSKKYSSLLASLASFTMDTSGRDSASEESTVSTLDSISESESDEEKEDFGDNFQRDSRRNSAWDTPPEQLSCRQRSVMLLKLGEKAALYEDAVHNRLQPLEPRGILRRNWLKISLFSGVAAISTRQLIRNRDELAANVDRFKRAVAGFYNDHLKGPIDSMWDELFVRKESHVADVEAIKDAKRSLSSMLKSFLTNRRQKGLIDIPQNAVVAAAEAMDMSFVSQAYENEIMHPIYYFATGDLVQMMLIQIQFIKKEMLNGMLAMDEIRKQQNLNMQLMALVPALLVSYVGTMLIGNSVKRAVFALARFSSSGSNPSAFWQRWFYDGQNLDVGPARESLTPQEVRNRLRLVLRDIDRLLHISWMTQREQPDAMTAPLHQSRPPTAPRQVRESQVPLPQNVDPMALANQIAASRDQELNAGATEEQQQQQPRTEYSVGFAPYPTRGQSASYSSLAAVHQESGAGEVHLPGLSYEEVGELALLLHRLWSLSRKQKNSISLDEWIRLSQDVQDLVNAVDGFSQQNFGEYDVRFDYSSGTSRALELALAALKRIRSTYSFCAVNVVDTSNGWLNQALRKLI
eukprot:gb/GECG01015896.1/.p1 GENE.gb/GECG01015896.1/~~gb/GECG01015896.1/.p1  ORF type:complete len:1019 (+),score=135.73 gb/GECG01015896.1/:1-3057(+)